MPDKPVALVTGGSRGIGRAIVEELARTHTVAATFRADHAAAAAVAQLTGAHFFASDVADISSSAALLTRIEAEFGPLDLLVNNAGVAPRERRDLLDAIPESFDEVLAANLRGPYFLTQIAARAMSGRRRGRIVFITSISSFTASVNRGEYCVSKAGLSMAAQLFAARLAPDNVQVFEIQPGIVRTDMIAPVADQYDGRIAAGLLPQRRMGEPEDVARVVRAIADSHLDYSTGQVLHVDGGFHLRTL